VDFGIVIDPGAATDLQCETVLAEPFCCSAGRIILLPKSIGELAGAARPATGIAGLCLRQPPLIDAALARWH
jgi:hypothetical protein